MKASLRFATFTLLLAAATTAAAVEASPLYDTAVLKRQSKPAHSYDHAYPKKHPHSAHVRPSVKLAHSSSQNSPSDHLEHAYGASETIKPANAGMCHTVGATGIPRGVFIGRLEILTIVVVRSEDHDRQWP
jgi:hypothetical protein